MVGFWEAAKQPWTKHRRIPGVDSLWRAMDDLTKLLRERFSNEPLAVTREFYDASKAGEKKAVNMSSLSNTEKFYLLMFGLGPMFQSFSKGAVHRWFVGKKHLAEDTDSSATRKLLSRIEFPGGRGGRRKKEKPAA